MIQFTVKILAVIRSLSWGCLCAFDLDTGTCEDRETRRKIRTAGMETNCQASGEHEINPILPRQETI